MANNLNKILGAADPQLTYTVQGLKFNDLQAAVVSGGLIRETGETVRTYQISEDANNPFAVSNTNYVLGSSQWFTSGTFTIMAPRVIYEIVETTGQAPEEDEKKREEILVADAGKAVEDTEAQSVPVCR